MGTRSQGLAIALFVGLLGTAHAGPKEDADKAAKAAMENYDLMDYDAAKKSLEKAIASATKAKLDKDPVAAKLHLYLGITSFAGGDADGAKKSFVTAIKIDPKIQIEAAYKSPDLTKLLEAARTEGGGTGPGTEPSDGVDCATVKGLQFTEPDGGKGGTAQPIEVYLAADVTAAKVSVMYRTQGATDFVEGKLAKNGGCKYTGAIPGAAIKGAILHYYVAAFDANNRPISGATAGNARTPNLLEIAPGTGGDGEDPIKGGGKTGGNTSGGNVSGGTTITGGKPARIFIAVVGGTGFGYVTGVTEANNDVQTCCIGNSLVVLTPELGYYVNQQLSIGLAARIGFPVGANVDPPNATHSTIAPGAMLRIRYALSHTGEGLRLMGQVGGGVMRNTIKLQMQANGGDTDIVAQGPLLVGAGIGFMKKLTNNLAFMADVSALAGIAVVDKLGTARLNSGVGGDVSLGLAVGF
jgi:hypothetical protein